MKAYIKFIDESAWCAMLVGWEPPKMEIENGRVVKPEVQCATKLGEARDDVSANIEAEGERGGGDGSREGGDFLLEIF
ncbi:hypothetical protein Gohar_002529 [Gossypium harknessii]|uniref:Gag-pol polyprotein n=1 Tax=Gossypium harknessii TaxID=34285 RepID=A0A7J9HL59_9ROSI|nr:hypothetical protein [Gossypium harknessii]